MHTLTGRRFDVGGNWEITYRDVAVGLSRIPRWAGATLVPWTVLQHSLAVHDRAVQINFPSQDQLFALWHDSEEMGTGDIPGPFKTQEQSDLAEVLRRWMYEKALHFPYPDKRTQGRVKQLDREARTVEVHCLCHPRIRAEFLEPLDLDACDVFWNLFDLPVQEAIRRFEYHTNELVKRVAEGW